MIKTLVFVLLTVVSLASCSGLKTLNSSGNAQVVSLSSPTISQNRTTTNKEVKFLDDISVTPSSVVVKNESSVDSKSTTNAEKKVFTEPISHHISVSSSSEGKISALQLKYAPLLNTEPELLDNIPLLEHIDEWYGTRYRMGGTTKSGVDCSAFVQAVYLSAFGVAIPRTAAEQFRAAHIISATELKEGDLVFFNTIGGISHVGLYLRNNKFVHASSSDGVKVSDLYESYYLRRYIGAGRIARPNAKI